MKIAILTFPITLNYGCVLQSFALQTFLNRMGHEVIILDKRDWRTSSLFGKTLGILKSAFRICIGRDNILTLKRKIKNVGFSKNGKEIFGFVDKSLNLSRRIYSFKKSNRSIYSNFDAYIVGSDQVWRFAYLFKYLKNYYFDFVSEEAIRISYAASFGVDTYEYPETIRKECLNLISRFKAISVREDSGVKLCKDYYNVDAIHVIDPVFLLSVEEYYEIFGFCKGEGEVLQTYILDNSSHKESLIEYITSDKKIKRKDLMPSDIDSNLMPVSKWLECIHNASYLITDSFHGTAFAILFNCDFVVMANPERGNTRIQSLLRMFNLEDRLITSVEEYNSISQNSIDWNIVNSKIIFYRGRAISFIQQALSK